MLDKMRPNLFSILASSKNGDLIEFHQRWNINFINRSPAHRWETDARQMRGASVGIAKASNVPGASKEGFTNLP
jgi:hypothetical protein